MNKRSIVSIFVLFLFLLSLLPIKTTYAESGIAINQVVQYSYATVPAVFGNGINGSLTISSNTAWTKAGNYYNFTSLTINSGVTLTVSPGVIIRVSGTLTVYGTISADGKGGIGAYVNGVAGGANGGSGSATDTVGGSGGSAGSGSGGSCGGGGGESVSTYTSNGGSYGGGGAAGVKTAATGVWASGGAGGGIITIYGRTISITSGALLTASGLDGSVSSTGDYRAAGGGGGGRIYIYVGSGGYSNSGTLKATGGNGAVIGGFGAGGGGGGYIKVTAPSAVTMGAINVGGGSGAGAGIAGGSGSTATATDSSLADQISSGTTTTTYAYYWVSSSTNVTWRWDFSYSFPSGVINRQLSVTFPKGNTIINVTAVSTGTALTTSQFSVSTYNATHYLLTIPEATISSYGSSYKLFTSSVEPLKVNGLKFLGFSSNGNAQFSISNVTYASLNILASGYTIMANGAKFTTNNFSLPSSSIVYVSANSSAHPPLKNATWNLYSGNNSLGSYRFASLYNKTLSISIAEGVIWISTSQDEVQVWGLPNAPILVTFDGKAVTSPANYTYDASSKILTLHVLHTVVVVYQTSGAVASGGGGGPPAPTVLTLESVLKYARKVFINSTIFTEYEFAIKNPVSYPVYSATVIIKGVGYNFFLLNNTYLKFDTDTSSNLTKVYVFGLKPNEQLEILAYSPYFSAENPYTATFVFMNYALTYGQLFAFAIALIIAFASLKISKNGLLAVALFVGAYAVLCVLYFKVDPTFMAIPANPNAPIQAINSTITSTTTKVAPVQNDIIIFAGLIGALIVYLKFFRKERRRSK
jgi:hypothetical protein